MRRRARGRSRRGADQWRRRARLDEQLAVLRVLHARVRRRTAEVTIRTIDAIEGTRGRLDDTLRLGAGALSRFREQAGRLLSRSDDR